MYLKCLTKTPISENEDFKIFIIEQNQSNPYIANKDNNNFKIIGNSFEATLEDNRCLLKNENDSNVVDIIKYMNENCVKINNSDMLKKGAKESAVLLQKNQNNFKNWTNVENLILNNKLKGIGFTKMLSLNYISFFVIKSSIYNDIIEQYYEGPYNFGKSFHSIKWDCLGNKNDKDSFVLEYLEDNGYYIEPFSFTHEGIDNSKFMDKLISIQKDKLDLKKTNNIKISYDEVYRTFSWNDIVLILKNKNSVSDNEILDYFNLFKKYSDDNNRVYMNKEDEIKYIENLNTYGLLYNNFKHSLNLNGFNIIIDFNESL